MAARTLALDQELADDNPAVTRFQSGLGSSHNNLGVLLLQMGKPAERRPKCTWAARRLRQKLSDDNPKASTQFRSSHVAMTYGNLGYLLRKTGKPAEAEAELRKNLALEQKLVDDNPKVPDYRSEVALALKNLGDVARMLGRNAEARDDYERAIALLDRLVAENSATTVTWPGFAGER